MPSDTVTTKPVDNPNESHSNPVSEAVKGAKEFAAHKAHPGPAIPKDMPQEEGTKEERRAKAQELNK
ncbi:hypothetical protein GGR57DRAFT_505678 [Xylariaceae sp. FL1272]|nr:hypothetical protein GGR57DRAFT_505678 [Xylariaceae sp. FL1272]